MIALHEPTFDQADEANLLEAIRSTWVSTGGPFVEKFERAFADFVGTKYAISVSNGTVGLQLMLDVLARQRKVNGPFDVIVPTLTFIATSNAVINAGGTPIFVDAAPGSMNLDPNHVAALLAESYVRSGSTLVNKSSGATLLAVMPAHIMGWCCDMRRLKALCAEYGVPIVEDAAEVLGSYHEDGRHLGRDGVASAFSFNGNKIITTGGGGMIVTDDDAFARRAKHLSTTAKIDGLRFVHDEVGYNYRMVNLLAALGCSQLAKLPARLKRKSEIFAVYDAALAGGRARLHAEPGVRSNNWLVNVLFADHQSREVALMELISENIQARPLWTPCHRQPAYKRFVKEGEQFPVADDLWARALSLPSSPHLEDGMISTIGGIVRRAAGSGVGT